MIQYGVNSDQNSKAGEEVMNTTLYRSPAIIRKNKNAPRGFSDLGIKNVIFNETSKLPMVTDRRGSYLKKDEVVGIRNRRNTLTMENTFQGKNFGNATYSDMIARNIIKH